MARNRIVAFVVGGLTILVCGFVFYQGYKIYREAEHAAEESCVLSIRSSILKTIDAHKEIRNALNPNMEWRALNKSERELLFNLIANPRSLDCAELPSFTEGKTRDGREFSISIREISGRIDLAIEGIE